MTVSVITASLPSRPWMLAEACVSVASQTRQPTEHLVGVDYERQGSAIVRNQLVRAAHCDWLAFLDDDDLLYPNHLDRLVATAVETGADLVYPWCHVTGRPRWNPSQPFDTDALREANYVPITVLLRRELFADLGGFRTYDQWPEQVQGHDGGVFRGHEDWDLWLRILESGGHIECLPEPTWLYRCHAGSKTVVGEAEAR